MGWKDIEPKDGAAHQQPSVCPASHTACCPAGRPQVGPCQSQPQCIADKDSLAFPVRVAFDTSFLREPSVREHTHRVPKRLRGIVGVVTHRAAAHLTTLRELAALGIGPKAGSGQGGGSGNGTHPPSRKRPVPDRDGEQGSASHSTPLLCSCTGCPRTGGRGRHRGQHDMPCEATG